MKKYLFFFIGLFVFNLAVQTANAQDVEFGIKGGLNLSTIAGVDVNSATLIPGLNIGPYLKKDLDGGLFIQSELLLSMKGYGFKATNYRFRESLTYFDWAIMGGYQINDNLGLMLGIQPSFMVDARYKDHYYNPTIIRKGPNSDQYRHFDLGLAAAIQYNVNEQLNLGCRFNYGLVPVFESGRRGYDVNLMFTLGYALIQK